MQATIVTNGLSVKLRSLSLIVNLFNSLHTYHKITVNRDAVKRVEQNMHLSHRDIASWVVVYHTLKQSQSPPESDGYQAANNNLHHSTQRRKSKTHEANHADTPPLTQERNQHKQTRIRPVR